MKNLILIGIFIFSSFTSYSQRDTIFFYNKIFRACDKKNAMKKDKLKKVNENNFIIKSYWKNNNSWSEVFSQTIDVINDTTVKIAFFFDNEKTREVVRNFKYDSINKNYKFKDYDENRNIKTEGTSLYKFPLCYTDTVKEYYTSGVLKQKSLYSNNQVISNEIWNEDGTKFMDNVFPCADEAPKFPGGNSELYKIISEKLIYPNQARWDNIQGKVLVRFVVMEDGSIDGVTITKSAAPILDEAALEMVKSIKTKWNPAKINGTSVRVFCTLPIKFSLE